MRLVLLILVLGMAYSVAYSQGQGFEEALNVEVIGVDLSGILTSVTTSIRGVGLIPDLAAVCRGADIVCSESETCGDGETCVGGACLKDNCKPLEEGTTRAFFMILLLVFMTFSIVLGLTGMPSAVISFFITSFLFNHVTTLFQPVAAQGLFEYAFSALFIFVWTDYILKYMWAISPTTRLFMEASVTMIALFFLKIEGLYSIVETLLKTFLGTAGFIMFMIFMLAMHFINTFISLTNIKAARGLRKRGGAATEIAIGGVERTEKAAKKVR